MEKEYVYQKHLRMGIKGLFLYDCITVLIFLANIIACVVIKEDFNTLASGDTIASFFISAISFMIGLFIMSIIIYLVLWRKFNKVSVILTDNEIIYNNRRKRTVIPYEDIVKVEQPSIKYTGGWIKIVGSNGSIRLTVVLENIGDFIYQIKTKLDELNKSNTYNEKKLFSFYKTAVYSYESWKRLYANIINYLVAILGGILVTGIIFAGYGSVMMFMPSFAAFCIVFGYLLGEIILGVRVKKRIDKERFCSGTKEANDEDRKIARKFVWYFTVIVIVLCIIVRVFVL